MLRITVAVLLALGSRTAFAQYSIAEVKDEVSRLDTRHYVSYQRALDGRDVFATIHDSIHHGAYKDLKAASARYVAIRNEISAAVGANDSIKATRRIPDLAEAGEALDTAVEIYRNSSEDAVQKIQIGLGVVAFLIACGVYLLFKRRKS